MTDLLADLKKALTSPDEDFVIMTPPAGDKTRVVSEDDMHKIDETAKKKMPDKIEEVQDEDEEESEGILNPKMEKAITILGIVAAVVIVIVVVLLVLSFLGVLKFNKKTETDVSSSTEEVAAVEMIDLTNMTYDEAEKALEELGLEILNGGYSASDDVEKDHICYQSEESGDMVAPGTEITVKLSSGPGGIDCPSVVGKEESEAINALQQAGLKYERSYESSDTVESGYVISQTPEAGESVSEGDTVTIVISQGKEAVKVPDLSGYSESEAKKALEDKGLTVGSVKSAYSDSVEEGKVISQTVDADKYVEAGTKVGFTISKGPESSTYKFSTRITAPSNDSVVSATIQLTDSSGNLIDQWTDVDISQFGGKGYQISVTGIEDSSGTVYIEWELEDGSVSTQEQDVTFEKE